MNALTIQHLSKIYRNDIVALRDINLAVAEGDFFALLGPNGAGKTTLIGIISSLVKKTSGKVFIFNHDIDVDFPAARSLLGVVPQEFNFNIFERIENILLHQAGYYGLNRQLARARAEKYLKKLELWDKRHSRAQMLSGGMKRRLMIARALMHEPKLLILDEPTAGVDVELRRTMWDFLREINQSGTTIILTTHYLEEAESLCKNVAIIDHGDIVENTSMGQLLYQLNAETFILNMKQSLESMPTFKGFPARLIDNQTLEVEIHSPKTLNELFTELSKHHIEIVTMRNKASRLEELFIKMTRNEKNE